MNNPDFIVGVVLVGFIWYNIMDMIIFKNTKVIILLVILLIVAVFVLVFFINKNKSNNESGQGKRIVDGISGDVIKEGDAPIPKVENIEVTEENKDDFNKVMKEAQEAFGVRDFDKSIKLYEKALTIQKIDKVYSGLYIVYSAKQDWQNAINSIYEAIKLNPLNPDYRQWLLALLDEKTDATFVELKNFYLESLKEIDPRGRVDLVTNFARIAESNNEVIEAISLWEKAKELFPANNDIYQKEIDRLKLIYQ